MCAARAGFGVRAAMRARMNAKTKHKRTIAEEFEARAATFRRVAADMKDPDDRAELLRIAAAYEEDAARIRTASTTADS